MKHIRWIVVAVCAAALFIPLACSAAAPAAAASNGRDDELKAAVASYVQAKTAGLGWETRIKRVTITGKATLPAGPLDFEVIAPQQWEGWGSVNLTVYARQNDRMVGNISLRIEVEALADMVVALRQLDTGAVLAPADISVQRRDVAAVSGRFIRSSADVVGKKTRTTLKANQPLRMDQLEKVPLIKSGQMVTIIAENDVLKVSVAGKAKGNGAEGDIIMVQNLSSLKDIPARVVSASTVQVSF